MTVRGMMLMVALLLPLAAGLGFYAGRESAPTMTVKLDNAKVTITESRTPEGGRRETYTRPTDQIIVFIDEAQYEAVEAGKPPARRHRQPGDIVWHNKGEAAPALINKGKAYRNLVIALK